MGFLQHTLGILIRPSSEWTAIRNAKKSYVQVFVSHVPILALIPVVSAFIGVTQVGWSIGDGPSVRLSVSSAATLCALTYVALIGGIYVFGEFINWMSKTYGVSDPADQRHYGGTALAVYTTMPLLLGGFALLYPLPWFVVAVLGLAACHSIYLIYEGIPLLMNIPRERAFLYASSVVTIGLVLMVFIMMAAVVIWGVGVGPVYVD